MKPSTTAASVLFTAGLGIVAGLGMHVLAVALAVIVVLILYVIGLIEDRLSRKY
ncbi:MgtC/SapB family protein [Modicisalibacter zincidurans]|uniref:MgtC/SapB family protein n=1 Tax=Modicisalibacter zincidurans TaxID=1178777 RepID=UPI003BF57E85